MILELWTANKDGISINVSFHPFSVRKYALQPSKFVLRCTYSENVNLIQRETPICFQSSKIEILPCQEETLLTVLVEYKYENLLFSTPSKTNFPRKFRVVALLKLSMAQNWISFLFSISVVKITHSILSEQFNTIFSWN